MAVASSQIAATIAARRRIMGGSRRRLRRPPVWLEPTSIERTYTRLILGFAERIEEAVRQILLPQLPGLVDESQTVRPDSNTSLETQRQDGWVERAASLISAVTTSLSAQTEDISAVALDIGQKTSQWNSKEWQKILKTTLAVDVFQAEPYLRDQLASFSAENTRLISKMTNEAIGEIDGIVQRGVSGGRRIEAIGKDIQTRFGVTRNKAKLIARDQVAKLNSQLTQLRQTELGVTKYVWRTSRDERVRESHKVMQGKTAVWNDATVYIDAKGKTRPRSSLSPAGVQLHPGEDYQCRCYAEPVLEDLLPEEEAEKPKKRKKAKAKQEVPTRQPLAKAGDPLHNKWVKSIEQNEDERDAIKAWAGGSYDSIRKQQVSSPSEFKRLIASEKNPRRRRELQSAKKEAATLAKVMKRAPKYKGTVYRGLTDVPRADFEEIVKSDFITTKAFTSSSKDERVGLRFASDTGLSKEDFQAERPGRVLFVFDQSSGVDMGRYSISQEKEVLIPKGVKYKVTRRETRTSHVEDIGDVPLTRIWLKQVAAGG